jgi:preprotein translocase subunit SecA
MKRFGGDRVKGFMSWANMPEDEPIEHGMISRSIAQAQVRVEGHNFDIRKRVLEYDDVVNKQREVIYRQRREVLEKESMRDDYIKILEEAVIGIVDEFAPENVADDLWDLEGMYRRLLAVFPVPEPINPETMVGKDVDELENVLIDAVHEAYDRKTEETNNIESGMINRLERYVMLGTVDRHWQRHLTDLDVLREGIGLMSVAQKDPLVEYKRQSFAMWQGMLDEIRAQAAYQLLTAQVNVRQQPPRQRMQLQAVGAGGGDSHPEPVRVQNKLGRNDPCWCGSGKKYKFCHYKQDRANGK